MAEMEKKGEYLLFVLYMLSSLRCYGLPEGRIYSRKNLTERIAVTHVKI